MLKSIIMPNTFSGSPLGTRDVSPLQKFFKGPRSNKSSPERQVDQKPKQEAFFLINPPPEDQERKPPSFLQSLLNEKGSKTTAKPSKTSTKAESDGKSGKVKAYGANTNQGRIRNYNEDRVSIVVDISKPPEFPNARDLKCSLFAVFDGHGGAKCAEFLRDNFYQALIKDPNFPKNPSLALKLACEQIEKTFLANCENSTGILGTQSATSLRPGLAFPKNLSNPLDSKTQTQSDKAPGTQEKQIPQIERSGSCAIIVLILSNRP